MGKTTLYHPVSLTAIRGAAAFQGFKLAEVKQIYAEPERRRARYNVRIAGFPEGWDSQSVMFMHMDLQQCFMDDVEVHWLRQDKSGNWLAHIQVDLDKLESTLESAELA